MFSAHCSVCLALTDFSPWFAEERATEKRKSSTHTKRSLHSCCHISEWLLHTAQLALQQGSAGGKMCISIQHVVTCCIIFNWIIEEKLCFLPLHFCLPSYNWLSHNIFEGAGLFPLDLYAYFADGDVLNHFKTKLIRISNFLWCWMNRGWLGSSQKQQVMPLRWSQNESCLSHDRPRRTKYVLVLILSRELYELCSAEGREGGETATSEAII